MTAIRIFGSPTESAPERCCFTCNQRKLSRCRAPVVGSRPERNCSRCHDSGWMCEEHPEQPWPHGDCAGPRRAVLDVQHVGAAADWFRQHRWYHPTRSARWGRLTGCQYSSCSGRTDGHSYRRTAAIASAVESRRGQRGAPSDPRPYGRALRERLRCRRQNYAERLAAKSTRLKSQVEKHAEF
jgi:hypothetical protein